MIGKTLICLEVPAVGQKFDIFAPSKVDIATLTEVLSASIKDMSNGRYKSSGKELLVSDSPRILFNPELSLNDYDINDGAHLFLI